jgi:uncharacterized protein YbjT (DUF2867 family)
MSKRILIVGATGLVGQHAVQAAAKYHPDDEIHLLLRRPLEADEAAFPEPVQVHIWPVAAWPDEIAKIKPDAVISCLGTTIRNAGSQEAFRVVDLHLVSDVAKASKAAGAQQFLAVSSLSANAKSPIFYMKTKGEAEDAIRACGFGRVDIMQPSLLRGERRGSIRYGENLAAMLSPLSDLLMMGGMRKYRSIAALDVARAMVALLNEGIAGQFVHTHDDIMGFSKKVGNKS